MEPTIKKSSLSKIVKAVGLVLTVLSLSYIPANSYVSGILQPHAHTGPSDGGSNITPTGTTTIPVGSTLQVNGTAAFAGTVTGVPTSTSNNTFSGNNSFTGQNTFNAQISNSSTTFNGISAPTGVASAGVIYYDSSKNSMAAINNNGTATAFPDPPGVWGCTVRTGSASVSCANTSDAASTVSCVGNEKVIFAGCTITGTSIATQPNITSFPTNQGVTCQIYCSTGVAMTVTAVANCCL